MASPAENIAALVAAGHAVGELEAALGLSAGYLSKVRHGAVRPSAQLAALLEIVRVHPEALATARRSTGAPPKPRSARLVAPVADGSALRVLVAMVPMLEAAGVRWALAGSVALRAHWPAAGVGPGVDIIVEERDRHVLQLLREAGHVLAHHPPALAVCRIDGAHPNEGLRVHFPSQPPLSTAIAACVVREVDGQAFPVVQLLTLTLANLLSQRTGSEEAVETGLAAGVSLDELALALDELDALPPTKSPYILRVFDRELARRRLHALMPR